MGRRGAHAVTSTGIPPDSGVSQYDVGPGGTLSPKQPALVKAGRGPIGVTVSPDGRSGFVGVTPDGRSLYVASTGGYVWQYDLAGDGALVPKTPPRVAAGRSPAGLAVSPAVRVPTKDECKRGGWQHLGFENQGQCVASANRSARG